jgi:hypothetical protein
MSFVLLLLVSCSESKPNIISDDLINTNLNEISKILVEFSVYPYCIPDSCEGNHVVNELYYIDSYFAPYNDINKLDSIFVGYLIASDSSLAQHVQIQSRRPIYYVKRQYNHPNSDSSYFIFHSYLIDEYPMNYSLFSARIKDSKFLFVDSIHIGVSRNKISYLVEKYVDSQFKLKDNCHLVCDTISVMCDGLGGVCKYIFRNDTLHEIHFEGTMLE